MKKLIVVALAFFIAISMIAIALASCVGNNVENPSELNLLRLWNMKARSSHQLMILEKTL